MRIRLLSAAILMILSVPTAKAEIDWRREARHLVGGGDHRTAQSKAKLLAHKPLDQELRAALAGPDRFLALDVIAALKRKSLLPDLIRFSIDDSTGFTYLTMNALVDAENVNAFATLYRERLLQPATPATAKVILLDHLSRMNVRLDDRSLSALLLTDESAEVRSAALDYLRERLLRKPDEQDFNVFRQVLASPDLSEQRKIQAIYILQELGPKNSKRFSETKLPCPARAPNELKLFCPRSARVAL